MSAVRDTIAAIATPPGRGGIGVVRISGSSCIAIAHALLPQLPRPRQATLANFKSIEGNVIDRGIALYFPAPHSYTGEDVLELQAHGGPVLLDMLLKCALNAGARQARAGEFTERAFLNDQLDLSQAEAVADLIDAASERAVRAARRSLDGEFSNRVHAITESLIQLRIHIEAGLDFADDSPGSLTSTQLTAAIEALTAQVNTAREAALCGRRLRDGFKVVIAGAPNVGKSSLLNRLCGTQSAIVTDVPGTTRDLISESIILDGLVIELTDTAGLRTSQDAVEKIGIQRALEHSRKADLVLLVFDDDQGPGLQGQALLNSLPAGCACLMIQNKIDRKSTHSSPWPQSIAISAKSGEGFSELLVAIKSCAGDTASEGEFSARQRHVLALDNAFDNLVSAKSLSNHESELIAEELRRAQLALETITGRFSSDDLLGRIFSTFCIGK